MTLWMQMLTPTDLEVVNHPSNWLEGKEEDAVERVRASMSGFIKLLEKETDFVRQIKHQGLAGLLISDGLRFKTLLNEVNPNVFLCCLLPFGTCIYSALFPQTVFHKHVLH